MNGNQSVQDNNALSRYNSIDVRNPPLDNFNPSAHSSMPYFQDPSGNGLMQSSYSNQASFMVLQMVQQLDKYVQDNKDLKKSIRSNNQELERRFMELEEWKTNQRKEKVKLKENFEEVNIKGEKSASAKDQRLQNLQLQQKTKGYKNADASKAHKFTTQLKNENVFLKSKNVKLELRIQQLSSTVSVDTKTNVTLDQHSEGDNEKLHNKYLSSVEHLEHQLQEAIASCEEAQSSKEKLASLKEELFKSNQQLQQRLLECQYRLRDMEAVKQTNRSLESGYQKLLNQFKAAKEQQQTSEISNNEVKAQLLQVLKDVDAYEIETKSLKSEKQHCLSELNDARTHINQLQVERNQDKISLENLISEKTQALDDLFNDYDQKRIENQRLSADRDSLIARIFSAEESMQKKERESKDFLHRHNEEVQKLQDDVNFFKAQAEVYKLDFLQEREDRTQTHQENERLRTQMEQLQIGNRYDQIRR